MNSSKFRTIADTAPFAHRARKFCYSEYSQIRQFLFIEAKMESFLFSRACNLSFTQQLVYLLLELIF